MLITTKLKKLPFLGMLMTAIGLCADVPDTNSVYDLAPLTVTGETYAFGAQKLHVVDDDLLEKRLAGSLTDVFAGSPSIHVGGAIGPAEKIYIRGIEDKLFSISIDGATQAGYLSHHHGQYAIEPELIKRVIVEPGAGSATTGPGALAGSMKFQTKRAADFLNGDKSFGGFTKLSLSTNANEVKGTGAAYAELKDNWDILVAYTHAESDDYEDGKGQTIDFTAADKNRYFISLDGMAKQQHRLGLSLERNETRGTFRHRPNFAGYFDHALAPNIPVFMEILRETAVADYEFAPEDGDSSAWAKLFFTNFTIDRPSQYAMGYRSLGADLEAVTQLEKHALTYGLNFRDDTASFTGKGSAQGFAAVLDYQTIPDESIELYGLFIQDALSLHDRMQASLGLRFDASRYSDKDGREYSGNELSPNAGISFKVTDHLDLNLSYSQAYRGVTPIDMITANEGSVENAPDIDGETSENAEIGFQYTMGNFFVNGTCYSQTIDDIIINQQGIRDNAGELQSYGYDFLVGTRFRNWTLSTSLSHAKPKLNGKHLVDAEFGVGTGYGRSWTLHLEREVVALKCTLGWTYKHVDAFRESPDSLTHKEAYNVHGLFLHWTTGQLDKLALTVSISNLFNEHYVDHATSGYNSRLQRVAGLPATGRDIRIAGTYTF